MPGIATVSVARSGDVSDAAATDSPRVASDPGEVAAIPSRPPAVSTAGTPPPRPPTRGSPSAPSAPAAAESGGPADEIVITTRGLTGFWMVYGPKDIDVDLGLFSGVRILYSEAAYSRNICVVRDHGGRLAATCSAGTAPTAEGDFDDGQVTLRWWRGPANLIFHGTLGADDVVHGTVTGGFLGVSVTGAIPMTLRKLERNRTADQAPAAAALVRTVLTDLRQKTLPADRYTPAAVKRLQPLFGSPLPAPDTPMISYLGAIHVHWRKDQPETIQDVFVVESPTGQFLCRLARGDSDTVIDFDCRTLAS